MPAADAAAGKAAAAAAAPPPLHTSISQALPLPTAAAPLRGSRRARGVQVRRRGQCRGSTGGATRPSRSVSDAYAASPPPPAGAATLVQWQAARDSSDRLVQLVRTAGTDSEKPTGLSPSYRRDNRLLPVILEHNLHHGTRIVIQSVSPKMKVAMQRSFTDHPLSTKVRAV